MFRLSGGCFFLSVVLVMLLDGGEAIQCYQCDSDFDPTCKADKPFDRNINALVECNSDEAHSPGVYCVKKEYRSPGWWGWHKVTRRCGVSTSIGSDHTCFNGMQDRGVYTIECNCNTDGCNSSSYVKASVLPMFLIIALAYHLH